jgi:hypothetical protein
MSPLEAINQARRLWRKPAADDAYSEWFDAQRLCAQALRSWHAAHGSSARAVAYLGYCFALDREEQAATELERLVTGSRGRVTVPGG